MQIAGHVDTQRGESLHLADERDRLGVEDVEAGVASNDEVANSLWLYLPEESVEFMGVGGSDENCINSMLYSLSQGSNGLLHLLHLHRLPLIVLRMWLLYCINWLR